MGRLARLDGLRGIAILLVLAWHYYACQVVTSEQSVAGVVRQALSLAWSGVDLFFVLSGFLIAGILLDQRDAPNPLPAFYVRRACRIFPLYFLVLGLYVAAAASGLFTSAPFQRLLGDPLPLWSYATFTQNIVMGIREEYGADWLAVTWSLAVEEQFYLAVPWLLVALPRAALLRLLPVAILSVPALHYFWPGFHGFVNAPWRADSILSGVLLAVLVREAGFLNGIRARADVLRSLLLVLALGAGVTILRPGAFGIFTSLWLAALYAVLLLVVYAEAMPALARGLASPVLVWFGQRSFGIYLLHQVVSGLLHASIGHDTPQMRTLTDAGFTLLALAITLALAEASFRYYEQPFIRFGHRFSARRIK